MPQGRLQLSGDELPVRLQPGRKPLIVQTQPRPPQRQCAEAFPLIRSRAGRLPESQMACREWLPHSSTAVYGAPLADISNDGDSPDIGLVKLAIPERGVVLLESTELAEQQFIRPSGRSFAIIKGATSSSGNQPRRHDARLATASGRFKSGLIASSSTETASR